MDPQEKKTEVNPSAAGIANLNAPNAPAGGGAAASASQPIPVVKAVAPQAAQPAPQPAPFANPVYPQGVPPQGVPVNPVYPQGVPPQGVPVNPDYPQGVPPQGAYPYAPGAMQPGMQPNPNMPPQITVYVNNPPPQPKKRSMFGVFLLFFFSVGQIVWAAYRYNVYSKRITRNSFGIVDPLDRFFKDISQTGDILSDASSNADASDFLFRVFADDLFTLDFSSNFLPPLAITTFILFCSGAFLLLVTLFSLAAYASRK